MLREDDRVALRRACRSNAPGRGRLGIVVHVQQDAKLRIDSVALNGGTVAVATLGAAPGSPRPGREIRPRPNHRHGIAPLHKLPSCLQHGSNRDGGDCRDPAQLAVQSEEDRHYPAGVQTVERAESGRRALD